MNQHDQSQLIQAGLVGGGLQWTASFYIVFYYLNVLMLNFGHVITVQKH